MEKRSIVIPLRLNAGEIKRLNRQAENANISGQTSQQSVDEMVRIARRVWELVKEQW